MKIVIDPGHGGYDPGAIGNGLREADVCLQVALRLASILEQAGASIKLTRDSDIAPGGSNNVDRDLQARCEIANSWPADYYVSIHCNSADSPAARGAETYCYKYGGMGEKLARAIQAELVATTGRNDRGVKEANFYVLRRTNMPAVLIELAFISNPEEGRLLGQAGYQQRCALAIARAITRTLGLPVPQEEGGQSPVATNTPKPGVFKDVSPTDWAAEDLEWLAQKGLLVGDTNGNFRPDAPLTRREGAVLMARILKFLGVK